MKGQAEPGVAFAEREKVVCFAVGQGSASAGAAAFVGVVTAGRSDQRWRPYAGIVRAFSVVVFESATGIENTCGLDSEMLVIVLVADVVGLANVEARLGLNSGPAALEIVEFAVSVAEEMGSLAEL